MNPTPQHLKLFRKHFVLTRLQAAHVMGIPKHLWVNWERGLQPMTPFMARRLIIRVKELNRQIRIQRRLCFNCNKNVAAAQTNPETTQCPYCAHPLHRSMKSRMESIYPKYYKQAMQDAAVASKDYKGDL